MEITDIEVQLRRCLDALGPAPRPELLHVLMLTDFDQPTRLEGVLGEPQSQT